MAEAILWIIGMLFSVSASPHHPYANGYQKQSVTYTQTVRRLKDWEEHCCVEADDQRFASLFADGGVNQDDLVAACRENDVTVAGRAMELLQVIGAPEAQRCRAHTLVGWANSLSDADFLHFEELLAPRLCEKAKTCKSNEFPEVFDSLVYALILDGSDRARKLLRRVYALRDAGTEVRFGPETLGECLSMISAAREANQMVRRSPTVRAVGASAFYIQPEYRNDPAVKFLGHSSDRRRMLFRVSYGCGWRRETSLNCGRGYVVVLERNSTDWKYALIAMEWIA